MSAKRDRFLKAVGQAAEALADALFPEDGDGGGDAAGGEAGEARTARKKAPRKKKAAAPKLDDAKAALAKVIEVHGTETAFELLGEFGAKRVSDVDEDRRADFVAACERAAEDEGDDE